MRFDVPTIGLGTLRTIAEAGGRVLAVEADKTIDEIYHRLSRTFRNKLGLQNFIFYELKENSNEMTPHVRHMENDIKGLPETSLSKECRTIRTGTVISSLADPFTCTLFPSNESSCHVCIPMQVSGLMIGVVQFLFPPETTKKEQEVILRKLTEARQYIAEALPVLHAKRLANRLKIMATADQLTGLHNRHYLENTLDRLVAGTKRRDSKICVLMCDIDHFKEVNDTYGHDAGDKVLVQLAKILLNTVRDADLVIRFGGEEFMILLVDCDPGTSREMAERIRREVQLYKFRIPGHTVRLTMSLGLSIFPDPPDQDIWDAFKDADVALYQAKEEGRNRIVQFKKQVEDSTTLEKTTLPNLQ
jgi:diguanylate cyclase (GGDEF)-like protein